MKIINHMHRQISDYRTITKEIIKHIAKIFSQFNEATIRLNMGDMVNHVMNIISNCIQATILYRMFNWSIEKRFLFLG